MRNLSTIQSETLERWETICQEWEAKGLQHLPASDAARQLGVSDGVLRLALKYLRPGQYNPNSHKRHGPRTFVYESCERCGKDTAFLFRFAVVDKSKSVKVVGRQLFLCQECLGKITNLLESR